MKDGDVVKIDLGAHIDGFIAVAAFTTVVGSSAEKPATGRQADAVLAAYWSSQAALRLLKAGNEVSLPNPFWLIDKSNKGRMAGFQRIH